MTGGVLEWDEKTRVTALSSAEKVTTAVLAAATFRMLVGIVAGIIAYHKTPVGEILHHRQVLGNSFIWAADYGDGQGVALLFGVLLLCWVVGKNSGTRLNSCNLIWLEVLAVMTALGSLIYCAGVLLFYSGYSDAVVHDIGSGGYYLAYAVVGLCIAILTNILRRGIHRAAEVSPQVQSVERHQ
jgi:hypothetical protein